MFFSHYTSQHDESEFYRVQHNTRVLLFVIVYRVKRGCDAPTGSFLSDGFRTGEGGWQGSLKSMYKAGRNFWYNRVAKPVGEFSNTCFIEEKD